MGTFFLGGIFDSNEEYKWDFQKFVSQFLVKLITVIVGGVTTLSGIILCCIIIGFLFYEIDTPISSWILGIVGSWSLIEIIFYFYCLKLKNKLKIPMKQPNFNTNLKQTYIARAIDQCENPMSALTGWFPQNSSHEIGYECFYGWLSWAYYGKLSQDLNETEKQELEPLMKKATTSCPELNKPASIPANSFMKLHLDKVAVQHKPFIAYIVIGIIQLLGSLYMTYLGFEYHTFEGDSKLSYWSYGTQCQQSSKKPLFVVHGIGIGIAVYLKLMSALVTRDPNRQIFVLELPHISLKLLDRIPTLEETIEAIDEIYNRHNLKSCSWLGHSYGCIVTAWTLKERPSYISKVTLTDPVCFALWEPDLVYNFLYKTPPSPLHRLCQFFLAQDLLIASTLFCNFSWLQNVIFPEDIHCPAHIYISSEDFIINPQAILRYLKKYNEEVLEGKRKSRHGGESRQVGISCFHGITHGQFILSSQHITEVIDRL